MRSDSDTANARREFLKKCGKFAIVTPPAVTLLLSSARNNYAVAGSGFHTFSTHGNNGFGNGGDDGVPGNSGNNPSPNSNQKNQDRDR